MRILVCLVLLLIGICSSATFDGVIRLGEDGRYEAYMIPPFAANHASFVYRLPSGELLMAWFSGSQEGAPGVAIVLSRLEVGSDRWTKADIVSQRSGYSNQNPVLFYGNSTLHLFHSQQLGASKPIETDAEIWYLYSADGRGLNWSIPVPTLPKPGSFDRNRVVVKLDGSWMLPMYYSVSGSANQFSAMQVTDNGAASWNQYTCQDSNYLVQPSVIRPVLGNPHLIAFFRDRRAARIYKATSEDDGKTWTPPTRTTLPNNNAAIQANILQYTSNATVLVYNPLTNGRNILTISLSYDQGKTWTYSRNLEPEAEDQADIEYSYPSVLQSPDANIHVSYTYNRETIKYVRITEDWIKKGNK